MSKLYEALQNAKAGEAVRPHVAAGALTGGDVGELLPLLQAIEQQLPGPARIVMLAAASPKAGTSTVAGRLARVAAYSLGRSTLLMTTALPPASPRARPGQVADGRLQVRALVDQTAGAPLNPDALRANWDRLRQDYDLVVVDAPPATSALARAVAPTVDGVVLVLEAARTPVTAAAAARDSLQTAGARLLGMVMNKVKG